MELGQHLVGVGRDNGVAHNGLGAVLAGPVLIQARNTKYLYVQQVYVVRHFPGGRPLPLVEAPHRHQAASASEGSPESWFLGNRLPTRIDHLRTDAGVFRPSWDESPSEQREMSSFRLDADDGKLLGGGSVVASLEQITTASGDIPDPLNVGFARADITATHWRTKPPEYG